MNGLGLCSNGRSMFNPTDFPREIFTTFLPMHDGHSHELLPHWLKLASAILLVLLILNGYARKFGLIRTKQNTQIMGDKDNQVKIIVGGMTCNHCKNNVEKNLGNLDGVENVIANPENEEVVLKGDALNIKRIKEVVEDIGYDYKGEK